MAFEGLTEKISATFKKLRGKGRLKEADVKEAMREIRMALLEADVSYKVVKDFTKSVTERCIGADVLESLTPAQMIVKIVNEELCKLMGSDTKHININPNGPTVVMLVGLQGAGKTTNGAKLAGLFKKQNKNPLLVACDVYRPAAIEQLKVVGGKVDVPVFEMGQTDPVEEQAAQLVSQMTLEDKIAQMFVITPNALTGYASGVTAAGDTTKEAYQSRPVGGIVYMADNHTDPAQTPTMHHKMHEPSLMPILPPFL